MKVEAAVGTFGFNGGKRKLSHFLGDLMKKI
jgi:hypothetical protein